MAETPEVDQTSGASVGAAEILKQPMRIRTLAAAEQLRIIMALVTERNFGAAHDLIEQLGKKGDAAFYAWLEDALHDVAVREDWRKFIEEQK